MAKTTGKKISVKASASKPLIKTPPRDKTLGLEPEIRFYNLEDCDETAEGEEAEILVVHDSNLAVYKQDFGKREFPYIDTFNHEGPTVVNAMRVLTRGVLEHLDIISPMEVVERVAYSQRILRVDVL